jgi:hypothetical protein
MRMALMWDIGTTPKALVFIRMQGNKGKKERIQGRW